MSTARQFDDRGPDLQRWYSGYLLVGRLTQEEFAHISELLKEVPAFDVGPAAIELEYKGRDSSRLIVRTLLGLARLIQHTEGEVRCEVSGDADQLWFEFYRIRDGRLFVQRGDVVRGPAREVTDFA